MDPKGTFKRKALGYYPVLLTVMVWVQATGGVCGPSPAEIAGHFDAAMARMTTFDITVVTSDTYLVKPANRDYLEYNQTLRFAAINGSMRVSNALHYEGGGTRKQDILIGPGMRSDVRFAGPRPFRIEIRDEGGLQRAEVFSLLDAFQYCDMMPQLARIPSPYKGTYSLPAVLRQADPGILQPVDLEGKPNGGLRVRVSGNEYLTLNAETLVPVLKERFSASGGLVFRAEMSDPIDFGNGLYGWPRTTRVIFFQDYSSPNWSLVDRPTRVKTIRILSARFGNEVNEPSVLNQYQSAQLPIKDLRTSTSK